MRRQKFLTQPNGGQSCLVLRLPLGHDLRSRSNEGFPSSIRLRKCGSERWRRDWNHFIMWRTKKLCRLRHFPSADRRTTLEAGFRRQPTRDAVGAVIDGGCWRIEGYRDGSYYEVYRHTGSLVDGSGAEVYELGRRLAGPAGPR